MKLEKGANTILLKTIGSKMLLKQRIKKITQTHGSDMAVLCKHENVSDMTLFVDLSL